VGRAESNETVKPTQRLGNTKVTTTRGRYGRIEKISLKKASNKTAERTSFKNFLRKGIVIVGGLSLSNEVNQKQRERTVSPCGRWGCIEIQVAITTGKQPDTYL